MFGRKITYINDYEQILKDLGIDGNVIKRWKYTVKVDKVYVRGIHGFKAWEQNAPSDERPVYILNME